MDPGRQSGISAFMGNGEQPGLYILYDAEELMPACINCSRHAEFCVRCRIFLN